MPGDSSSQSHARRASGRRSSQQLNDASSLAVRIRIRPQRQDQQHQLEEVIESGKEDDVVSEEEGVEEEEEEEDDDDDENQHEHELYKNGKNKKVRTEKEKTTPSGGSSSSTTKRSRRVSAAAAELVVKKTAAALTMTSESESDTEEENKHNSKGNSKMKKREEISSEKEDVEHAGSTTASKVSGIRHTEPWKFYNGLVTELFEDEQSEEFRMPVLEKYDLEDVPDYNKFVKTPMDLGTIKKRLNNSKDMTYIAEKHRDEDEVYYELNESKCIADIKLVFENCKAYNDDESDLHILACSFLKKIQGKIRNRNMKLKRLKERLIKESDKRRKELLEMEFLNRKKNEVERTEKALLKAKKETELEKKKRQLQLKKKDEEWKRKLEIEKQSAVQMALQKAQQEHEFNQQKLLLEQQQHQQQLIANNQLHPQQQFPGGSVAPTAPALIHNNQQVHHQSQQLHYRQMQFGMGMAMVTAEGQQSVASSPMMNNTGNTTHMMNTNLHQPNIQNKRRISSPYRTQRRHQQEQGEEESDEESEGNNNNNINHHHNHNNRLNSSSVSSDDQQHQLSSIGLRHELPNTGHHHVNIPGNGMNQLRQQYANDPTMTAAIAAAGDGNGIGAMYGTPGGAQDITFIFVSTEGYEKKRGRKSTRVTELEAEHDALVKRRKIILDQSHELNKLRKLDMTFVEKQLICETVATLDYIRMKGVVDIVSKGISRPDIMNEVEIDLDIDSIDNVTLREIQYFIKNPVGMTARDSIRDVESQIVDIESELVGIRYQRTE